MVSKKKKLVQNDTFLYCHSLCKGYKCSTWQTFNVFPPNVKREPGVHYIIHRASIESDGKANTNLFLRSLAHWQFASCLGGHTLYARPLLLFFFFFFYFKWQLTLNWEGHSDWVTLFHGFWICWGCRELPAIQPFHSAKKRTNQVWTNPRNSLSCFKKTFVEQLAFGFSLLLEY